MIDLYYWPTPNGWKVTIMLEECGLPYTIKPVNIGRGDQLVACNIENDSKVCYQSACLEQPLDCRGPKLRNFVRECARGCFAPVTCGGRG